MSDNSDDETCVYSGSKKRKKNTNCWKTNQRKIARDQGQTYVTKKGKEVAAKTVGPSCK